MNNPTILEAQNFNAWFGTHQALKNINLDCQANSVLSIIGPSGCGKSTFIRCLNRLHEETPHAHASGKILLKSKDIYAQDVDPVALRRRIGMVFQKPNPFPAMSIFDNVVAGLKLAGVKSPRPLSEIGEKCLKDAALWDEVKDNLNSPGTSLSGGQQQRLCIARALAVNPTILLMDEPTSALDPVSSAKVEELVVELKKEVTIMIVTHNMQQAARISDKTAFFLSGELVEVGVTQDIFRSAARCAYAELCDGTVWVIGAGSCGERDGIMSGESMSTLGGWWALGFALARRSCICVPLRNDGAVWACK